MVQVVVVALVRRVFSTVMGHRVAFTTTPSHRQLVSTVVGVDIDNVGEPTCSLLFWLLLL